jgi:phosphohistidine phosphatase
MLVGHNPSLTDLANNLTGGVTDNLPTCGVVRMTYEVDDWKEVGQSQAKLILFDYPKNTP